MIASKSTQTTHRRFVAGFEHDIFVSYAHVDDLPFCEEPGWVSTLVNHVNNQLAMRLGGLDRFSIWWDRTDLRGNASITPAIQDEVRRSATILLVLSPGYLESKWCRQELDLFFESLGGEAGRRVFIVRAEGVPQERVPGPLSDILGYKFWYEDPTRRSRRLTVREPEPYRTDYRHRVGDLAEDLSLVLKTLSADSAPPAQTNAPIATVYLAEVTDDLEGRRDRVASHLGRENIRVLPARRYLEGQAFREALDVDLAASSLFVQLLGEHGGRRPESVPQGYARLQFERAKALGVPVLQWRDPALVVDEVAQQDHRELLEATTVYAEAFETFRDRAAKAAATKAPAPKVSGAAPFVFINAEPSDRALAEQIRDLVSKHTLTAVPISEGPAQEIREDLEQKLRECDALIVVYGQGPARWVDAQLLQCNRIAATRKEPLRALRLLEGPPKTKREIQFRMPGLEVLAFRDGVDEAKLKTFLDWLLQRPAK